MFFYIVFPLGKKVYIIGIPEFCNTGDIAISLAQAKFLRDSGYSGFRIKEITRSQYARFSGFLKKHIGKNQLICGIGGGNMGNLWYNEEELRCHIIRNFPENPIIIFPQTIFFTDDEQGRQAVAVSKAIYESHHKLTLAARDLTSYEMMHHNFHSPHIILVPDIVLYTNASDYGVVRRKRSGVVIIFRDDKEKYISDTEKNRMICYFEDNHISFRFGNTMSDKNILRKKRKQIVKEKIQEFAASELIITDRLHGMIFSAITGTPCIVFGNNHHKVKSAYDLISYLPYIKYAETADEAIAFISQLIQKQEYQYDRNPLMEFYNALCKEIAL